MFKPLTRAVVVTVIVDAPMHPSCHDNYRVSFTDIVRRDAHLWIGVCAYAILVVIIWRNGLCFSASAQRPKCYLGSDTTFQTWPLSLLRFSRIVMVFLQQLQRHFDVS